MNSNYVEVFRGSYDYHWRCTNGVVRQAGTRRRTATAASHHHLR